MKPVALAALAALLPASALALPCELSEETDYKALAQSESRIASAADADRLSQQEQTRLCQTRDAINKLMVNMSFDVPTILDEGNPYLNRGEKNLIGRLNFSKAVKKSLKPKKS